RARHGAQRGEIEPALGDQYRHEAVQRLRPQQGTRRGDQRIGLREYAAARAVAGKVPLELERPRKRHATLGARDFDDDAGLAACAAVESEVERHSGLRVPLWLARSPPPLPRAAS